jgi:membrane fusion protein (multidrug efflux system)
VTVLQRRFLTAGTVAVVLAAIALGAYFIVANGRNSERPGSNAGAARAAVLITTTTVEPRTLEVYEEVVGSLENVIDPTLAAEVAGRITRVHGYTGKKVAKGDLLAEIDPADFEIQSRADLAEMGRLGALLEQQARVVERQQKLVAQGFISQSALDDAIAQRNALREQLNSARARSEATRRSLSKARVLAPIVGEIETQIVAVGDYVKIGDPLFRMVGVQRMRARLPLPESAAGRLRPGLKVELTSPASQQRIQAQIDEIKPTVGTANRALEAIVNFDNEAAALRGGGSVNARIIVATREGALMLPEESVVLRPAGKVVYAVQDGRVRQRVVKTGLKQDGLYEVVSGLSAGDVVAVDGAGFLTDGAAVTLSKPRPAGSRSAGEAG